MRNAASTPAPEGARRDGEGLLPATSGQASAWLLARARQARLGAGAVPSPCISVCRMDPKTALCEGCYRTMDEICEWAQASDADKRQVWARIAQRAAPEAV